MPTLVELRQERGALIEQQRKILAKADGEKRELTVEEKTEDDRLFDKSEKIKADILRRERVEAAEREMAATPPPANKPEPEPRGGLPPASSLAPAVLERLSPAVRRLVEGAPGQSRTFIETLASPDYATAFRSYLTEGGDPFQRMSPERRNTMQMDQFSKGGGFVPPLEFVANVIKAVDDEVFIRRLATKYTVVQAAGLGAPSLDTDVQDADWTTELQTGNVATVTTGKRELRPHPLAKQAKISNKLARASAIPIDSFITARLAYKFGITMEKAYLLGTGAGQPLGVFTASTDGIPTSRDVQTGSATDVTGDGLIDAKYSLKAAYWPRLTWILSREFVKRTRKLKDAVNGQYHWMPGLQAGQPDRIIDTPYVVSEYVPATFTTGLYVGMIGDFSQYWIVDALDLTIQRLVELYAATNETGYIGRLETDGAPVLAEAFSRLKTN